MTGSHTHTVVYSLDLNNMVLTNLNTGCLNLDDFMDYTISEYLEDRAGEGATVLSSEGNVYRFSDGCVELLTQKDEPCEWPDLDADPEQYTVWVNLYHSTPHNVVYAKLFHTKDVADDQADQAHIVFRRHRFGRKAFALGLLAAFAQEVAPFMS